MKRKNRSKKPAVNSVLNNHNQSYNNIQGNLLDNETNSDLNEISFLKV